MVALGWRPPASHRHPAWRRGVLVALVILVALAAFVAWRVGEARLLDDALVPIPVADLPLHGGAGG
ncbi:hypothetical protein [Demequina phytophila]|uniref:hypothetical protein n=1 Tax=Demequina phytophila TaxID=1638981 RepID=UPI000780A4AA|nr:hypothetical protein [Demequina phytophila]